MQIEVSIGEVVDKISILEIKMYRIKDPDKLRNIEKEFLYLLKKLQDEGYDISDSQYLELHETNKNIWEAEETIRLLSAEHYKESCDHLEIVNLAEDIHTLNDKRARIKKAINLKYKSNFIEEKSYEDS